MPNKMNKNLRWNANDVALMVFAKTKGFSHEQISEALGRTGPAIQVKSHYYRDWAETGYARSGLVEEIFEKGSELAKTVLKDENSDLYNQWMKRLRRSNDVGEDVEDSTQDLEAEKKELEEKISKLDVAEQYEAYIKFLEWLYVDDMQYESKYQWRKELVKKVKVLIGWGSEE